MEDGSTIIIRDDGVGMTLADFRDFFASIGRPGKSGARAVRGKTVSGRRKIGRFGIGSLAVVGTADKFSVRSTRKASGEGFEASIDLKELRKHFNKGEDLASIGSSHMNNGVANRAQTISLRCALKVFMQTYETF